MEMDDEIDIEEHDILEHPQVKATFPDLSRIQIEVHASGAALDSGELCNQVLNGNLLEERPDYEEDQECSEGGDCCTEEYQQSTERQDYTEGQNYSEEDQDNAEDDQENAEVSQHYANEHNYAEVRQDYMDAQEYTGERSEYVDDQDYQEDRRKNPDSILKDRENFIEVIDLDKENLDPIEIPENEAENQLFVENKKVDANSEVTDEIIIPDTINSLSSWYEGKVCESKDEFKKIQANKSKNFTSESENGDESNVVEVDDCELIDEERSEVIIDTSDYYKIPIKHEYDENYTDFNETMPDETYNSEDLPPEDIYHFNNKIILGSKPSPVNFRLCEKIPHAIVLLEDWGSHLDESQSYCKDCQILFTTPNALDAHKMIAHSFLTPLTNRAVKSTAKSTIGAMKSSNTARKSTSIQSSTFCNHCNVNFENHIALITHLYEVLPSKSFPCTFCDAKFQSQNDLVNHSAAHVKIERKILKPKTNSILRKLLATNKPTLPEAKGPENCKFKCTLCSAILATYTLARSHRHKAHPETAHKLIFKRIITNTKHKTKTKDRLIYEKDKPKAQIVNDDDSFDMIPKSALFKCLKCSLHFMTSHGGTAHWSRKPACDTFLSKANRFMRWSCPTCKKTIKKADKNIHQKQHEMSTKFKIYNITKTTYTRTLCKCLQCGVHYEYIFFKQHVKKCGKIPTAKCQKCNILLDKKRIPQHRNKHFVNKLKPKDFIIVDYEFVKKNEPANDKKQENKIILGKTQPIPIKVKNESEKEQPKIINSQLTKCTNKIKMYYCKFCKNYMGRDNARSVTCHLSNRCKKCSRVCEQCGIRVPWNMSASHGKLHAERNISLKDYEFYDLKSLKPMIPQVPNYPKCTKCMIHFLQRKHLKTHICGEDYDNCDTCGDKYELTALSVHRPFHKLRSDKRKQTTSGNNSDKINPELIMKYESLNAIWNILFICGKCDLVTDLYNKAVEHSQRHLKKEHSTKTIKCYICNMKFEESCWSKHSELHARMTINGKHFKILKYAPENLLDESWFQMFDSLPENEIRQIIDRSVFGSERGVRMQLVKDGLPEFTIYCCSECEVAYDSNDIISHVRSACKISAHICIKCNIAFDRSDTLKFHELLHKRNIKTDEFRIVHFLKNTDKDQSKQNKESGKAKSATKIVNHTKKAKKDKINENPNAQFSLYKCRRCSCCLHRQSNVQYHKCNDNLIYCKICKQKYERRNYVNHLHKHKVQSEFTLKNINVTYFEPLVKPATMTCHKGRRVTSRISKAQTKNQDRKGRKLLPNKVKSTNSEPTKKENHTKRTTLNSSKRESLDSSVESVKRIAKIYKCDCGLHYTSLKTIEKHIETCDDVEVTSKENCSKCGRLFPTDILVSHLCKHHSQDTNIQVQEVHKKNEVTSTETEKPKLSHIKLYKCSRCNVYYMNQSTCYKHALRHTALDPKDYIECKICSLQFTIRSLQNHMKRHHQTHFYLEKVLVEEYHPSVGKAAPIIDIYFANERLESVQVSSTND